MSAILSESKTLLRFSSAFAAATIVGMTNTSHANNTSSPNGSKTKWPPMPHARVAVASDVKNIKEPQDLIGKVIEVRMVGGFGAKKSSENAGGKEHTAIYVERAGAGPRDGIEGRLVVEPSLRYPELGQLLQEAGVDWCILGQKTFLPFNELLQGYRVPAYKLVEETDASAWISLAKRAHSGVFAGVPLGGAIVGLTIPAIAAYVGYQAISKHFSASKEADVTPAPAALNTKGERARVSPSRTVSLVTKTMTSSSGGLSGATLPARPERVEPSLPKEVVKTAEPATKNRVDDDPVKMPAVEVTGVFKDPTGTTQVSTPRIISSAAEVVPKMPPPIAAPVVSAADERAAAERALAAQGFRIISAPPPPSELPRIVADRMPNNQSVARGNAAVVITGPQVEPSFQSYQVQLETGVVNFVQIQMAADGIKKQEVWNRINTFASAGVLRGVVAVHDTSGNSSAVGILLQLDSTASPTLISQWFRDNILLR